MNSARWAMCVAGLFLISACAWGQALADDGANAMMLGRGGVGVALTSAQTTGLLNPALLGLTFGPETASGATSLDGGPDEATRQAMSLSQGLLPDPAWDWGSDTLLAGYLMDVNEQRDLKGLQVVGGKPGRGYHIGLLAEDRDDLYSLAYGQSVGRADGRVSGIYAGARVGYSVFGRAFDETVVDLGFLADLSPSVDIPGVRPTAGLVIRNLGNAGGHWPGSGRTIDLGVGLTGSNFTAGVDVRDLLDDGDHGLPNTGRRVNLGGSLSLWDGRVSVLGGLQDGEPTYGISAGLPFLRNIPVLRFTYARSEHEDRAELLIVIKPHIIRDSD